MLESSRAGLQVPLPSPKKDVALQGRDIVDLGPVDVSFVEHKSGAIEVRLLSRVVPDGAVTAWGATVEVLPQPADTFCIQAAHLIKGIPETHHDPVPDLIVRAAGFSTAYEALGEVAWFQVRQTGDGFEMAWATIEGWRAVRCAITFGQVVALANRFRAILNDMTPEDHKARMVDLTPWGGARQLSKADGEAPVGAFIKLTEPAAAKAPTLPAPPDPKLRAQKDEGPATMAGPSRGAEPRNRC